MGNESCNSDYTKLPAGNESCKDICHDFPWYLPTSFGAKCIISGNQTIAPFAELYNLSLFTLFIPKVMFKDGQITPNSMTQL